MNEELIFVYNANGDLFSTVSDFAHKMLSPSTYQCHLCTLTFGNFSMKQEWKSFIEDLPLKTMFFHKDEFKKEFALQPLLPSVFVVANGIPKEMLTKADIESCLSLQELKNVVVKKLNEHVQHHHSDV